MVEDIINDSNRKVENGDVISVDYIGKLEDGTVFDTSIKEAAIGADIYNENRAYKPLTFTVGAGQMIEGFDKGVVGMEIGEEKTLIIPPEEAYGEYRTDFLRELPIEAVNFTPEIGMQLATDTGMMGIVTEVKEKTFLVDFNHQLAGKTLMFEVKIVSMEAQEQ
jgi:FKBP-type peptidyl-prolyl cis-trans isomerase 2